jgi:hypothetical protein
MTVTVAPGAAGGRAGFQLARTARLRTLARVAARLVQAGIAAVRSARARHPQPSLPQVARGREHWSGGAAELSLSVIVVSHNRWPSLSATLARLQENIELAGAEIIVVDNASTDGSAERAMRQCPGARVITLDDNLGVAAFNRGVAAATGDIVLVLDDDAWPGEGVVSQAMEVLAARADIGAVTLHPRHPESGRSEWRFADRARPRGETSWPVMGCGNLVRRQVWLELGGYDEEFFLYRNDADLALRMLAASGRECTDTKSPAGGTGVWFHPDWVVWHASQTAGRKSARWHRLATRNWVWMARRHGRGLGLGGAMGLAAGWLWAHRLAGWHLGAQIQTLVGGLTGLMRRSPRLGSRTSGTDARPFLRLVRLQLGMGFRPN